MGIAALRKLQLGQEAQAGTKVAATTIWRGKGAPKDQRSVTFPDEHVGLFTPTTRNYAARLLAGLTMAETEATFEQLPYLFAAGIENTVTGAPDGTTGEGKIYQYDMASAAAPAVKTFSIEAGDDSGAEVMEYCFVRSISLRGAGGEALRMSAEWVGRQLAPQAFTAALSAPSVEEILFSKGALYIDAIDGTVGTTVKASTLLGMDLAIPTGLKPEFTADGQLYFTFIGYESQKPDIKLVLTFVHNAVAVAQKAVWRAGTPQLVQVKFTGSALSKGDGVYDAKTLKLNFAGAFEDFDVLDEQDGNSIIKATFKAAYDVANSKNAFQAIVVNALATLP